MPQNKKSVNETYMSVKIYFFYLMFFNYFVDKN
jgi:hypothetical protein